MTDQTPDAAREVLELSIADDGWALGTRSHYALAEDVRAAVTAYAAAVSRSRDAEWREAVKALRWTRDAEDEDHDAVCGIMGGGQCESCISVDARNAALSALLARMDTASAGGADE